MTNIKESYQNRYINFLPKVTAVGDKCYKTAETIYAYHKTYISNLHKLKKKIFKV